MRNPPIELKKVRVHNLKSVDLTLEPFQLIVFTGVSGSGKSSLAFDTIYVEGQRRYIESLSTHLRRYFGDLPKPDAERLLGISPTIAIEQKSVGRSPRSTVGTLTGIYDFLRVLYARLSTPHCPISKEPLKPQSPDRIVLEIQKLPEKSKVLILAPYAKGKKGEFKEDFEELVRKGFLRIRLDGEIIDLTESISIDKRTAHDIDVVIDRLVLQKDLSARIKEDINAALEMGKGLMSIYNLDTKEEILFSQHAYSPKSDKYYPPLEPQDFSFNHPSGMCEECEGLGVSQDFDLDKIIDPELSIAENCCIIAGSYSTIKWKNIYDNLGRIFDFEVKTPWKKLPERAKKIFLFGTDQKYLKMRFYHPEKKIKWTEYVPWKGVFHETKKRISEAKSERYIEEMQSYMQLITCPLCHGSRLKAYPSAALFRGKPIAEVSAMTTTESKQFFGSLELDRDETAIGGELLKEIRERLRFLEDVGLHYLTLDRTSPSLSGGESQRVRLASQIGSGLVGATYILDEPSIGLHQRDNQKLLSTLKLLRDRGNTVIVVEHDEETIFSSDVVVDVGPGAGFKGGEILHAGPALKLLENPRSITGAYLSGKSAIPIPKKRRKSDKKLTLEGASHHNLKQINVSFPLGTFIAVTGVSGSGKSSLITDTLYPILSNALHRSKLKPGPYKAIKGLDQIDKIIAIDQAPIGRTTRSNPATYIKLFDDIRDLFAKLPESQALGYKAGRFSFNVHEGSCPHCQGMGKIKVDMDFLEDAFITCPHCEGRRFDKKTLSVTFKDKTIFDILELPVGEALEFFSAIPAIHHKLNLLSEVGLDYMRIGQSSTTLSGGEAQRIKLAKELVRPPKGHTFYILDEPTTGLHMHDIAKLIAILQKLVDEGNTVLVIEHNLDLIKTADHIIDLGPEGGGGGGKIVGEGTPESISKKNTPTGEALRRHLNPHYLDSLKKELASRPKKGKGLLGIDHIHVEKAAQNYLKDLTVEIPRGKISIFTGPSGSGKTSLAFETLYAEGQRRYVESLSTYAKQYVKQMPKPIVEYVDGLSPAIAIEQKKHAGNPRSTVGTMTEIYDYLRILFTHLGRAYDPETGEEIKSIGKETVFQRIMELPEKTKIQILAPFAFSRAETIEEIKQRVQKLGFLRIRLNKKYYEVDEEISFEKGRKHELMLVVDRLIVKKDMQKRLREAIETAADHGKGQLVIALEDKDLFFNLSFAVESTGKSFPPITPHTFSFNTEEGMCRECLGLGIQWGAHLESDPYVYSMTPFELIELLWGEKGGKAAFKLILKCFTELGIDVDTPIEELEEEKRSFLFFGSPKFFSYKEASLRFIGVNETFKRLAKVGKSELKQTITPHMEEADCSTCKGARLNPLARGVLVEKRSIAELCTMQLSDLLAFIQNLTIPKEKQKILEETLFQLESRLQFMCKLGLDYLFLNRSAPTLSGGETQRIRLSRGLGSGLTGCLFVLDEPTIGLHPKNSDLLNECLKELRDRGNTIVLVEHDPLTIEIADRIFDFGPEAGKKGGNIVAEGTLEEIKTNPLSLTGAYLSGEKKIPLPENRRPIDVRFSIENASLHNLKNISVSFPLSAITCITGVSGSGKSTLMHDILRPAAEKAAALRTDSLEYKGVLLKGLSAFDKVISIDQSPIGHTIRADVSTYIDLLTPLRRFFAELPAAKIKGLLPKHFSFNHIKGMCRKCWGLGFRSINLQFLPSVRIVCDGCQGYRLNPLSLEVSYQGKHLGHILKLTVDEAKLFLPPIPKVHKLLDLLSAVGLNYLQIGQEIQSLSGGEAQRLRLTRELAKRSTGKTLYLFDEPTIGLHMHDTLRLIEIFHQLADRGNTLLIIEHNLDIIAQADYVVDLGPGGGKAGGKLIAEGPPEEVSHHLSSSTASYLKEYLESYRTLRFS